MIQKKMFWTSKAGYQLFATLWQPATGAEAVVTLIHGFGEHCSRYEPYAAFFVEANIAFVAFDLYGHGQSEGKQGTIINYNSLLDDIELALNKTAELFSGKPIFLYGHSMGGNLALNYLLANNSKLLGGIISSPWLKLYDEPNPILQGLVALFQKIIPDTTINSGLKIKYISTISEEVEKYRHDPLNHGKISFLMVHEIAKYGNYALQNTSKLKTRVLMLHGTDDHITSFKASEAAAKGNPGMIEFMAWEKGYHELHNDTMRVELAASVIQWIKRKIFIDGTLPHHN